MKIVKTADDSYVGLLRLSQHKPQFHQWKIVDLPKEAPNDLSMVVIKTLS